MNGLLNSRRTAAAGGCSACTGLQTPQFVLADEPTANLDSKSASNLLDIMDKLNHDRLSAELLRTTSVAINGARRVITLVDGRIVSDTAAVPPHMEEMTT